MIAIWGTGREGRAALKWLRAFSMGGDLVCVDEGEGPDEVDGCPVLRGQAMREALARATTLVKSPGVSLYHPLVEDCRRRGVRVTSLLNLWFESTPPVTTIAVTGTKGKSTTTSLLTHVLNGLGHKAVAMGNIGQPVTEVALEGVAYAVLEVSSYQAADFQGMCDVAVVSSLYPEHLSWHGGVGRYYQDKLNLLYHAGQGLVSSQVLQVAAAEGLSLPDGLTVFHQSGGVQVVEGEVWLGAQRLGLPDSPYLRRPHNVLNVCAVLAVIQALGLDVSAALRAMTGFAPLPHRQCDLGEKDGILYVDDSISTTPQAAMAALESYKNRPVTLLVGGFDRGVDQRPLVDYLQERPIPTVCMGATGQKVFEALLAAGQRDVVKVETLAAGVQAAQALTPRGGVILLSPAASSQGMFKDFIARGQAFARAAGF